MQLFLVLVGSMYYTLMPSRGGNTRLDCFPTKSSLAWDNLEKIPTKVVIRLYTVHTHTNTYVVHGRRKIMPYVLPAATIY